jgi:hypothetical protein
MSQVRVLSLTQREFSWSTAVMIRTHFLFAEDSKPPVKRGWSNGQIIGFTLGTCCAGRSSDCVRRLPRCVRSLRQKTNDDLRGLRFHAFVARM